MCVGHLLSIQECMSVVGRIKPVSQYKVMYQSNMKYMYPIALYEGKTYEGAYYGQTCAPDRHSDKYYWQV